MANNFGSIVGGIVRGLSNDKRSAGLTGSNVKTDNPHTYRWIGQETSDLRQPIEKEMSQNPSLPFEKTTSGTEYSYTNPLPTDIRTLIQQGSPGTDIAETRQASSIGSTVQTVPPVVPINNWNFSGMGMSPQNGDHFKYYFANQIGVKNQNANPLPANVLAFSTEQANTVIDGSHDVWNGAWQTFISMRKNYQPSTQFREGVRYS